MGLLDSIKDKLNAKPDAAASTTATAPGDGAASTAPDTTAAASGDEAATPASTPATAAAPAANPGSTPPPAPATPPPPSALARFSQQLGSAPAGGGGSALNPQVLQAVQLTNSENAGYAASQIAVAPNMMITQASGLVAQAGANYFDGASKLALASKSVLLKNMTEKFAKEDIKGAAEDALGVLITDLLVGTAAAVAAASGAAEAEAAHFALEKIDQSLDKYQTLLSKHNS